MAKRKTKKKPKAKTLTKKTKDLPGVIKAISIIDYVYGIMFLFGAVFVFLGTTLLASLGILGNFFPDKLFAGLAGGALLFGALVLALMGVVYIYLGKAIKEYKMWAKILQIILAILGVFSFPIGTVIGIFMLWVLLVKKETKNLFH